MKRLVKQSNSNYGINVLDFSKYDGEFIIEFTMKDKEEFDTLFPNDQEELDIRDVDQYFEEISSLINLDLYDYDFDDSESRVVVLRHENPCRVYMSLIFEEEE